MSFFGSLSAGFGLLIFLSRCVSVGLRAATANLSLLLSISYLLLYLSHSQLLFQSSLSSAFALSPSSRERLVARTLSQRLRSFTQDNLQHWICQIVVLFIISRLWFFPNVTASYCHQIEARLPPKKVQGFRTIPVSLRTDKNNTELRAGRLPWQQNQMYIFQFSSDLVLVVRQVVRVSWWF